MAAISSRVAAVVIVMVIVVVKLMVVRKCACGWNVVVCVRLCVCEVKALRVSHTLSGCPLPSRLHSVEVKVARWESLKRNR